MKNHHKILNSENHINTYKTKLILVPKKNNDEISPSSKKKSPQFSNKYLRNEKLLTHNSLRESSNPRSNFKMTSWENETYTKTSTLNFSDKYSSKDIKLIKNQKDISYLRNILYPNINHLANEKLNLENSRTFEFNINQIDLNKYLQASNLKKLKNLKLSIKSDGNQTKGQNFKYTAKRGEKKHRESSMNLTSKYKINSEKKSIHNSLSIRNGNNSIDKEDYYKTIKVSSEKIEKSELKIKKLDLKSDKLANDAKPDFQDKSYRMIEIVSKLKRINKEYEFFPSNILNNHNQKNVVVCRNESWDKNERENEFINDNQIENYLKKYM
jgi:hypothetical protein